MALITVQNVEKAFGDRVVLRGADLVIEAGDRVGLVGVNGSGKSTLLRILAGEEDEDSGEVRRTARLGLLDQEPRLPGATVGESAKLALSWHVELLAAWEAAVGRGDMDATATLQSELDLRGWDVSHQVEAMLSRVHAPPADAAISRLSGGELRRVALARVLLEAPEVLLLDEPTNHLDADTVDWLEGVLSTWRGAVVFVTHDRYLLESVAERIIEVEDGLTVSYDGSYADYLVGRAERRARLEMGEDRRLAIIAREAEWASRSPAARSTKQKGRLDRLEALRAVRPIRKEETFTLDLRAGIKLGTVAEARGLRKAYGKRTLFANVDLDLVAGDRVGIMGPNGAGKSTLLGVLAGTVKADGGDLHWGPRVRVALLDQSRSGLKDEHTVWEAAGGGNDHVQVGDTWVHVISFLGRFLFNREQMDVKVSRLSGGERARLLLAKLLLTGASVILLDEPTNDLDLTTLSVLEEALLAFDGAAVVVTHDRAFLDRVCNKVLNFEGDGLVMTYASRSQAVEADRRRAQAAVSAATAAVSAAPNGNGKQILTNQKKLSFKEQKELDGLPAEIEKLEQEHTAMGMRLSNPATFRGRPEQIAALHTELVALEAKISAAFSRWEALEARRTTR